MTERRFHTLAELRRAARAVLLPEVWDFLEGGASREHTCRRNTSDFTSIDLAPRLLGSEGRADLGSTVLGVELSMPVATAPLGAGDSATKTV